MNEEITKNSLEEKTRRSLNWSTASNVLSKLIMPLTNMILARLLTKDIFGIVASINIVIALAEIFADSGFSKYLVQADFESEKQFDVHKSVSFWTSSVVSLIMLLAIVILRDSLATLIGSEGYGLALAIAAIQIPIYSFSSISTAILRRNFEFKKLFFVRMSGVVITLTVSVIFALLKFEHWALIVGSLASITFQTVILFILSKFKLKFVFNFSVLKQMIYFSINSFLEALLAWAASSIILAFVNIKLGNDISGIYKMGNTTVSGIFNTFSAIFIPVLFSNLSRQKEDNKEFHSTYFAYQRSAAYVIIPAVIGVTIFSPLIVNIFLGSDWSEVEEIIAFQATGFAINILFRSFPGTYFLAKGKPQKLVITQIIWLLMYLPVSYFAIDLGIVTFVKISVIFNIVLSLITYVWLYVSYKVSIKETLLVLVKPIIVSIPMAIIGFLSHKISMNLFFQLGVIVICALIYFGTFYLVFKNDFKKLISLFVVIKHKKLKE